MGIGTPNHHLDILAGRGILKADWRRVKVLDYGGPTGVARLSEGGRQVEAEAADDFINSLETDFDVTWQTPTPKPNTCAC